MRRILVVHTGGIGDFLLCCPSVQRLARDASVELLGRPGRLALALEAGFAEQVHDIESTGFDSLFAAPSETIRAFLRQFDAAVVWMRDDGGELERAMRSCGLSDVRVFPGLPPNGWERHASEYYLDCLGFDAPEPCQLTLPRTDRQCDVILHPGSGGKRKNWPFPRFKTLAERLHALGRRVHWCIGPAEEELALPRGAEMIAEPSLRALARVLSSARAYVGNDSGITHLAAACGLRTVAVFGPTDPRVWAPLGPHVRVVNGAPWPGVDAVMSALLAE